MGLLSQLSIVCCLAVIAYLVYEYARYAINERAISRHSSAIAELEKRHEFLSEKVEGLAEKVRACPGACAACLCKNDKL
jgi:hypothetical protein